MRPSENLALGSGVHPSFIALRGRTQLGHHAEASRPRSEFPLGIQIKRDLTISRERHHRREPVPSWRLDLVQESGVARSAHTHGLDSVSPITLMVDTTVDEKPRHTLGFGRQRHILLHL